MTQMGTYTCKAVSKTTTKTSSVNISIAELFPKPHLQSNINDSSINEGDLLSLSCSVPGLSLEASNKASFYLQKDKGPRKTMGKGGKYSKKAMERDSGLYACEVKISNITKRSNTVQIDVYVPVKNVNFAIHPSSGKVDEGTVLALVCSVEGGSLPIEFQFYVNKGSRDILLHNITRDDSESTFIIPSFSKSEDGIYFCKVSNRANHTIWSHSLSLTAVFSAWKKGIIGVFVIFLILAILALMFCLCLNKKKKGHSRVPTSE
ncbi:platelet endothelial cell adhesion molecule-like [Discoglossus pictus]